MMTAPTPKLQWRGVSKRFGGEAVLDALDLDLAAGRSLVIIGRSGEGKSVSLKIALGLLKPDAGVVLFDGQPLATLSATERRRRFAEIGVLFQGGALFDSLCVWENVAFRLLNVDGLRRDHARARALEALERVQLDGRIAERRPAELSGGMQKRVGLARAIVCDPDILFLDEPTTGLDPITADAINDLIVDQVRRLGCTAVTITHDLASARRIGDEIALLQAGRIAWRGPIADLDQSSDPDVRAFTRAGTPARRAGERSACRYQG